MVQNDADTVVFVKFGYEYVPLSLLAKHPSYMTAAEIQRRTSNKEAEIIKGATDTKTEGECFISSSQKKILNPYEKVTEKEDFVFCLRVQAISYVSGMAVRGRRVDEESMRKVYSTDAAFMYGSDRGTMTHISSFLADGEVLVQQCSFDGHNEGLDSCFFSQETFTSALGAMGSQFTLVHDRMKGQSSVTSYLNPEVNESDCVFHLKENLQRQSNGGMTRSQLKLFERVYSPIDDEVFQKKLEDFART